MDAVANPTDINGLLIEAVAGPFGASVVIFDRDDRLIHASRGFRRYFPLPDDLVRPGARLRDFLGGVFDCGMRLGVASQLKSTISREDWIAERIAIHWRERYENVEQLPDGRFVRLGKRRLPNGVLLAYVVDVTGEKRREPEQSCKTGEVGLARQVLRNLPNPVIVKDSELRYTFANDAFCKLIGLSEDQIVGRKAADIFGEEASRDFERTEREVLSTGQPVEYVEDIPHANGATIRTITRKHRCGDSRGYYVTISLDRITLTRPEENNTAQERPGRTPGTPVSARILIVDENAARAAERQAELCKQNCDAMSVRSAREALDFLDTARSMGVAIDRLEASQQQKGEFERIRDAGRFELVRAMLSEAEADVSALPLDSQTDTIVEEPSGQEQLEHVEPELEYPAGETKSPSELKEGLKTAPAQARTRPFVLVAEDNEVNQIVFGQILDGIDVDYQIVNNGQEAVDCWRQKQPDLVLMDVSMPVLNGHQATMAIRQAEDADGQNVSRVPVIAVTAHAMMGDADQCYAAGMDDFLTKPISPEKLEAVISDWISKPATSTAAA